MKSLKYILKNKYPFLIEIKRNFFDFFRNISDLRDLYILDKTAEIQRNSLNPFHKYGKKCFSQTDEDGITLEIIKRIGCNEGSYIEFGVGDGLECNTIILASLGWRGCWVGGEDLAFTIENKKKFLYIKDWITLENISNLARDGLNKLRISSADLISLDLDGNDIYFVKDLLCKGFLPKIFIVEYNGKFPPPIRFQIEYDPKHQWNRDDYYGASLSSFVDLFNVHGYSLICCNAHTGSNAFFVKNEYIHLFPEVPSDISMLYVAPRYYIFNKSGHRQSPRTIHKILNG
jgi:hypothetical protein